MPDREPTVINTGGGYTGWVVAIILALIVIGALLLFTGVIDLGGGGTDVNVNVPAVETPSTEKPATETPATGTPATGTPDTGTPATGTPDTGTPATGGATPQQ
jgi:hypothetical protein